MTDTTQNSSTLFIGTAQVMVHILDIGIENGLTVNEAISICGVLAQHTLKRLYPTDRRERWHSVVETIEKAFAEGRL